MHRIKPQSWATSDSQSIPESKPAVVTLGIAETASLPRHLNWGKTDWLLVRKSAATSALLVEAQENVVAVASGVTRMAPEPSHPCATPPGR